jgi:hypothetical protein
MSWPKYYATETNNRKGEDFSHKERAISTTLAASATDFLKKSRGFYGGLNQAPPDDVGR